MLAEAETASGLSEGITDTLHLRLTDGEIPVLEVGLRMRRIQSAIEASDPEAFARGFRSYLDAFAFLEAEGPKLQKNFKALNPPRGEIPECEQTGAAVDQVASDAIFAFGMRAALANRKGQMGKLQDALRKALGQTYPASALLSAEQPTSSELDSIVAAMLRRLDLPQQVSPKNFWLIGLRFFERSSQSNFGRDLEPLLAAWLRSSWARIVQDEAFRLTRPLHTVPPIRAVLASPKDDRVFIAALLLAASDAVGSPLSPIYSERLRSIAAGQ